MQLFILDRDPAAAAASLCDVHLRKMCLETAQILSGVILRQGRVLPDYLPKPCNCNHPVIRALDSPFKVNWVIELNIAMQQIYRQRFGKTHAYSQLAGEYGKILFTEREVDEDWSFFRNFKACSITEKDIVEAYRIYYRYKKTIIRNWQYTNSCEPEWLNRKNMNT